MPMLLFSFWRRAGIFYTAIIVVFFSCFFSFVIAPDLQKNQLGWVGTVSPDHAFITNRKFGDFPVSYIPEIKEHLTAKRSGWLSLWTNNTELGRPLYQLSGFSSAWPPSWVMTRFMHDPWRFITTLSLGFCYLAGLFILLFAREEGLSPIAGLMAGVVLATSPLFMYWLTFPMFPATWCWAAGALWAMTRLARHPDMLGWVMLAFSGYSLLMTAYPQPVVHHMWLLGGYGLWLASRQVRISRWVPVKFLSLAASALMVGAALALPVYLDLMAVFVQSSRVAPDPSFFTAALIAWGNLHQLIHLFVLSTIPEIFGNPIAPSFPFYYDGLSVTLIVIFFAVFASLTLFKKTWGWWLAIFVICLFTFVHPLYVLGIKYLGFNLSPSTPLGCITLPLTVITASGIDTLARRTHHGQFSGALSVSGAVTLIVIATGVAYVISKYMPIRLGIIAGLLTQSGLLMAQRARIRPMLLVLALFLNLMMTSYPLMLKQDPAQIAMTSPLVEKIRENLPPGSRYAVAAPGISMLPPNLNATLGLASVHSHNSLTSRRYQNLIKSLGGKVYDYGQRNRFIAPDYGSTMFWMSNISLVLSKDKITDKNLKSAGKVSGIHLYRVVSRMGESLQVILPSHPDISSTKLALDDPRDMVTHRPVKTLDQGDVLAFRVKTTGPSVFLLSQNFYRDWKARADTGQGWRNAQTVIVNGLFQGVLLPAQTHRVRLDFKPFARYAWIAHVFWLLMLVLLIFRYWQKYQEKSWITYAKKT